MADQPSLWARLERDGFVVIPSVIGPDQLAKLRAAAAEATALARSGGWEHIRTVGKQFPPWPKTPGEEGIWGVQGLLHPDLPGHDEFARLYFSDAILGPSRALINGGCADDDLVMELFNMLVDKVQQWDPEVLAGYEVQNWSWGYLVERGDHIGSKNLTPQLRPLPHCLSCRPRHR